MFGLNASKIRVMVANASTAKCYETSKAGRRLDLVKEYNHPQSREKGTDLITDRPFFYDKTSPKEVEADRFAKQLADDLKHFMNQYEYLVMIAPPHFHGLLNKHCDAQIRPRIIYSLEKDYTKNSAKELGSMLNEL